MKLWTTGDIKQVAELAGTMPERELRKRLKLSKRQLQYAKELLRKRGTPVSTHYFVSKLVTCPSCGKKRSTIGRHGICEPCRLRRQLAETESMIADLMHRLTREQRAVYEQTESERESKRESLPKPPNTKGLTPYEAAKAKDDYARAAEQSEITYLTRRIRAAQKRRDRIKEKVIEKEGSES